jgi:heptose I phosphotransferase
VAEVFLRADLVGWAGDDPFQRALELEGEVYRAVANRRTVRFETGARAYFAKIHGGVGWGEIIKNLLTLRLPVVGARNEFVACRHLERCGIPAPTVAAFGERGLDPARRFSFVVCDALEGRESLEDLAARWRHAPPGPGAKRRLIESVAAFARRLHGAGLVHRDFYICHLLLKPAAADVEADLAVIDLHRARVYAGAVPGRWLRRDLAALLFSVLDEPLTQRDWLRFLRVYRERPLRHVLQEERKFWDAVYRRARGLYRKGQRKGLVQGSTPKQTGGSRSP